MNLEDSKKIYLDLTPFMAKAMGENVSVQRELDAILAEGWLTEYERGKKQPSYDYYYKEYDSLTKYYCSKAAALLLAMDTAEKISSKAIRAFKMIMRHNWQAMYTYILREESPVDYEGYCVHSQLKAMKLGKTAMKNKLPGVKYGSLLRSFSNKGVNVKNTKEKGFPLQRAKGEFALFLFSTHIMGKEVKEHTGFFDTLFKSCLLEQEKVAAAKAGFLPNGKEVLVQQVWGAMTEKFQGIPKNFGELRETAAGRENNGIWSLLSQEGLPCSHELDKVEIAPKELRSVIATKIASLDNSEIKTKVLATPEENTTCPIKESFLQEIFSLWSQAAFVKAFAAEYGKLRQKYTQEVLSQQLNEVSNSITMELKNRLTLSEERSKVLKAEREKLKQEFLAEQKKMKRLEQQKDQELTKLKDKLYIAIAANEGMLTSVSDAESMEDSVTKVLSEELLAKLSALKVVVLGGKENFRLRMRAKFPGYRFIAASDAKYDLSVLDKADVVVICWQKIGHPIFLRTIGYIGRQNEKIAYLANTNEQFFIDLLAKHVR